MADMEMVRQPTQVKWILFCFSDRNVFWTVSHLGVPGGAARRGGGGLYRRTRPTGNCYWLLVFLLFIVTSGKNKKNINHQETKPSANPFASKGANPFQENQANPFHWRTPLHGCEPLVVSPTAVFPNYFILVWQHIPCLIFLLYQGCEQIVNFFTSYFSGWSSSNLCRSWFSQKLLHFYCVLLNKSPCI